MTPKRKQRLALASLMLIGVGVAVALTLSALSKTITLFRSPSELAAQPMEPGVEFRIGGMVVEGSVNRGEDLNVEFDVTDRVDQVTVRFDSILPDLFSEGQGVVARGALNAEGIFIAEQVLAKHDENYMPPEVAEALEKAGQMPGTTAKFGAKTVVTP
jgi:cytochrome c-type biogenesis protein CcmE